MSVHSYRVLCAALLAVVVTAVGVARRCPQAEGRDEGCRRRASTGDCATGSAG